MAAFPRAERELSAGAAPAVPASVHLDRAPPRRRCISCRSASDPRHRGRSRRCRSRDPRRRWRRLGGAGSAHSRNVRVCNAGRVRNECSPHRRWRAQAGLRSVAIAPSKIGAARMGARDVALQEVRGQGVGARRAGRADRLGCSTATWFIRRSLAAVQRGHALERRAALAAFGDATLQEALTGRRRKRLARRDPIAAGEGLLDALSTARDGSRVELDGFLLQRGAEHAHTLFEQIARWGTPAAFARSRPGNT